ncbi:DUF2806 domain-containing protein [Rhizobium leguminosarum]
MVLPVPIVLGKTGEALVNRVSNAIGVVFEPHRMRREARAKIDVAKAEVKAEVIRAEGRLTISEIEARGLQRMIYEEGRNQENIESVTAKAIPHLSENAKPEDLDEDFVRYLFDKAKLVSNEEMQELWAKILAKEAHKAGSFSRRAIDLVSKMSKSDAELFTKFVRNVWIMGRPIPIVPKIEPFSNDDGFSCTFDEIQHLESIGLVNYSSSTFSSVGFGKIGRILYYGSAVDLEFTNDEKNRVMVGQVLLTTTGAELGVISGAESSVAAYQGALEYLMGQGITISVPLDSKEACIAL